jgi:antitoxin (DNA-binding transcriptional repressor) of toxin-antitoxin stability system
MKTVGIRELKNRLSECIRHARSGEGVLVTDRGEVVAELRSPGHEPGVSAIPPGLVRDPAGYFAAATRTMILDSCLPNCPVIS